MPNPAFGEAVMSDIGAKLTEVAERGAVDDETHVISLNIAEVREILARLELAYRVGVVLGMQKGIELDGSQAGSREEILKFTAALNNWGKQGGKFPTPAWA
jgi:hypothetical protein